MFKKKAPKDITQPVEPEQEIEIAEEAEERAALLVDVQQMSNFA